MAYDNTNSGTLGKNKRKEKDTHHDYSGQINIDGVDYWLSGWLKTAQATGEKFFSLSVRPKDPPQTQQPPPQRQQQTTQQRQPYQQPQQRQQTTQQGQQRQFTPPPQQQPAQQEEHSWGTEGDDITF